MFESNKIDFGERQGICMSKIGIMGGTFNPIHNGHLALAEYAMDELKLDEVWFIPTGCSYMKKDVSDILPGEERLMMARLATQDNDRMKCLDIEIKRDGYTYSYETLEQLKCEYPENQFYFIFGADCLFTIEVWRYPERIFENCTVVAAVRNGADVTQMKQKIAELSDKYQADICLASLSQFGDFLHDDKGTHSGREKRSLSDTGYCDHVY